MRRGAKKERLCLPSKPQPTTLVAMALPSRNLGAHSPNRSSVHVFMSLVKSNSRYALLCSSDMRRLDCHCCGELVRVCALSYSRFYGSGFSYHISPSIFASSFTICHDITNRRMFHVHAIQKVDPNPTPEQPTTSRSLTKTNNPPSRFTSFDVPLPSWNDWLCWPGTHGAERRLMVYLIL